LIYNLGRQDLSFVRGPWTDSWQLDSVRLQIHHFWAWICFSSQTRNIFKLCFSFSLL